MRRCLFLLLSIVSLLHATPASAQGRWDRGDGAHVLVFKSYTLPEGQTEDRTVLVFGGSARIDGIVRDDVVVLGGSVTVGPRARIDGDLVALGGSTAIDPAARIDGEVTRSSVDWPDWRWHGGPAWGAGSRFWSGLAAAFTVGRVAVTFVIALLLVAVAPTWINRIAWRVDRTPGVSAAAGLAVVVLGAPALVIACILLVISILGIPLLALVPVVLAGLALLWVAGYAAVAGFVGARLRGVPYGFAPFGIADVAVGAAALSALTLVGHLISATVGWMGPVGGMVTGAGTLIEWIAWTLGLGAALLSLRRGPLADEVPPPLPPLVTPAPSQL